MERGIANKVQFRIYWLVPVGLMVSNFLYWTLVRKTTVTFPLFVALVPFLFGLFGVGMTTRLWHIWSWKLSWVHVAFQYSAYGTLGPLFLNATVAEPFSAMAVLKMGVLNGVLIYLTGTVFDVHSVEEGLLGIPHASGVGTVNRVASYSFYFFGYLGLCVGLQSRIAYHYLVELGRTDLFVLLTFLAVLFMSLSVLGYFGSRIWLERRRAAAARLSDKVGATG